MTKEEQEELCERIRRKLSSLRRANIGDVIDEIEVIYIIKSMQITELKEGDNVVQAAKEGN